MATEKSFILTSAPPPQHFVLVPLVLQGHTIPMVDLACLLVERGARVSLVTTTANAARLHGVAERARRAMLPLEIVELPFPPVDEDLPAGCKDMENFIPLIQALQRLAGPLEAYVRALARRPSCIIYDSCNSWTAGVARSLGVPQLLLQAPSCFYSLCNLKVATNGHGLPLLHEEEEEDAFLVVPGMPMRVELSKDAWSSAFFTTPGWEKLIEEANEAARTADGFVLNTFLELEGEFVALYEAALGKPVWALAPLFLGNNRDQGALVKRGGQDKPSVVEHRAITAWLDAMDQSSVTYVSFGSLVRMLPMQLYEVGHGLEDSGRPFLWVVKDWEAAAAAAWLQALEARTAGRGLVVRGWAPQLTILAHPAVGGFVTHCGWNSFLESLAQGVPVVTWPHFADQFLNERLAVDVLGVGVPLLSAAAANPVLDKPVLRGDVARAVSELMGPGELAQERRRKAKEYGERAHRAVEEGGSSYENLTKLMQSFTQ